MKLEELQEQGFEVVKYASTHFNALRKHNWDDFHFVHEVKKIVPGRYIFGHYVFRNSTKYPGNVVFDIRDSIINPEKLYVYKIDSRSMSGKVQEGQRLRDYIIRNKTFYPSHITYLSGW